MRNSLIIVTTLAFADEVGETSLLHIASIAISGNEQSSQIEAITAAFRLAASMNGTREGEKKESTREEAQFPVWISLRVSKLRSFFFFFNVAPNGVSPKRSDIIRG